MSRNVVVGRLVLALVLALALASGVAEARVKRSSAKAHKKGPLLEKEYLGGARAGHSDFCQVYPDQILLMQKVHGKSMKWVVKWKAPRDLASRIDSAGRGNLVAQLGRSEGSITYWYAYHSGSKVVLRARGASIRDNDSTAARGLADLLDKVCRK